MWWFPKMGVPPAIIQLLDGDFPVHKNHPASLGYPHDYGKPPLTLGAPCGKACWDSGSDPGNNRKPWVIPSALKMVVEASKMLLQDDLNLTCGYIAAICAICLCSQQKVLSSRMETLRPSLGTLDGGQSWGMGNAGAVRHTPNTHLIITF